MIRERKRQKAKSNLPLEKNEYQKKDPIEWAIEEFGRVAHRTFHTIFNSTDIVIALHSVETLANSKTFLRDFLTNGGFDQLDDDTVAKLINDIIAQAEKDERLNVVSCASDALAKYVLAWQKSD